MKFLITGGAGFIGSHLVDRLINKNNEIVIIDDFSTGKIENMTNNEIKFVRGDITDLKFVKRNIKDIDYVFHEAAIPSVPRSILNPFSSNNANINGTLNILIASNESDVKKVIYASSSSVYGDYHELPKREDMIPNPLSPYAVTKLTGEYYCNIFHDIYGLKTVSLRYFNVFGPRQDPMSEYAAVIPKFIMNILGDNPPIIYGDGFQSRDFTYIKDIIQANILAYKSSATGIFNAACGKAISINELVDNINDITNKNILPIYEKPRKGDIKHSLADISKIEKILGYKSKYSIQDGLKETIKWFEEKKNGFRC